MKIETKQRQFDAFQITPEHLTNAKNKIKNNDWPKWLIELFDFDFPGKSVDPKAKVFFGPLVISNDYYFEICCNGSYEAYAYDWIIYIDGNLIVADSVTFDKLFQEIK